MIKIRVFATVPLFLTVSKEVFGSILTDIMINGKEGHEN